MEEDTSGSTALVEINPNLNPAFTALVEQVHNLRSGALGLTIWDPEGVKKATADLSLISELKRATEDLRTSYTRPLDSLKKAIQEVFKVISGPLEEADSALRGKVKAYNRKQEEIRAEAARIQLLRKEAEERAAKLSETTGEPVLSPPPPAPLPIPQPAESVDTTAGSLNMRTVRKWRLSDFETVPDKYKQLNEALITKVVKAGEPDIPGLQIYTEKEPVITARR